MNELTGLLSRAYLLMFRLHHSFWVNCLAVSMEFCTVQSMNCRPWIKRCIKACVLSRFVSSSLCYYFSLPLLHHGVVCEVVPILSESSQYLYELSNVPLKN